MVVFNFHFLLSSSEIHLIGKALMKRFWAKTLDSSPLPGGSSGSADCVCVSLLYKTGS